MLLIVVIILLLIFVYLLKKESFNNKLKETNKNIDLVKFLKGYEGEKIYCALTGEYVIIDMILNRSYRPIIVKDSEGVRWSYSKEGYKFDDYPNGDCMLYSSKTERDWNKFK